MGPSLKLPNSLASEQSFTRRSMPMFNPAAPCCFAGHAGGRSMLGDCGEPTEIFVQHKRPVAYASPAITTQGPYTSQVCPLTPIYKILIRTSALRGMGCDDALS